MSNLFHPYDPALWGTGIPKPSNSLGQDKDQDQAQNEENKKDKEIEDKKIEDRKAWEQIKTQVDVLGDIVRRIRQKDEMSLQGLKRELEGIERIVGMLGKLCRDMLGEELEGGEEDIEDEADQIDKLRRHGRRQRWEDEGD
ncbi:uncharacterized protein Bfra_005623 [Botrytis fragariae]|uniref:Uncharacterized protein n=1 Tax=Botrytis fragariae TaxID=1964551 RepID=A0A8H6EHB3_9HELO|nr:uncharacterized protein Bfra_005623 [Botrytis fragariae]KAF5872267.1 hypothetical protein Bfra_005623 [Botrytis fragariae]